MQTSPRVVLFLTCVLLLMTRCTWAHIDVTPEQAWELLETADDLIVIDVREPSEYCDVGGHLPGALNYPLFSGVLYARYAELPMDRPILVVCGNGGRSTQAADFLDSQGFLEVYDMTGGMNAWVWETGLCKYSGGSGTPDDPYQIARPAALMALGDTPEDYEKHFILVADIDLDPNASGRQVFDRAVVGSDTPFGGVFDGDGHVVRNLTIQGSENLGLFGKLKTGATISGLGLEAVNVNGTGERVGALVGLNRGGNVTACYSSGSVTGTKKVGGLVGETDGGSITASYASVAVSGGNQVGGLVGYNVGPVAASFSAGAVTGYDHVGGLVGTNWNPIMVSYATGTVAGHDSVGGLVGFNVEESISASYSSGVVTGETGVGGLVGRNYGGRIFACFWDLETSGQLISGGGTGATTVQMQDINTYLNVGWDFVEEMANGNCDYWEMSPGDYPRLHYGVMPEGLGTIQEPYLIRDVQDLGVIWVRATACYRLEETLDVSGVTWSMAVVPWFGGIFDGNGRAIDNLRIQGGECAGLFGQLGAGARVVNLGLAAADVTGTDYVGGLVGRNYGGKIAQGRVTGKVSGDECVGGLVGANYGFARIVASYGAAQVSGLSSLGGLVGHNEGNVTMCSSSGKVNGHISIGGALGQNSGVLRDSYSTATVTGHLRVGGLVGENDGSIAMSYSTGLISGVESGGLVGWNNPESEGGSEVLPFRNEEGNIVASFWDVETSGLSNMCGHQTDAFTDCDDAYGLTTSGMQTAAIFLNAAWDFADETENGTDDIWWIHEGQDYPRLWWELIPEE